MIDTTYETGRILGYSDSVRLNESVESGVKSALLYTGALVTFLTAVGVAMIWIFTLAFHDSRVGPTVPGPEIQKVRQPLPR